MKYILISMLFVSTVLASGSRPQKPGKPPKNPDIAKYNSGKSLFTGKKQLPKVNKKLHSAQLKILQAIEAALPKSAKKIYSVIPLAGRVTDKEIDDLKYYLSIRYKIKKF